MPRRLLRNRHIAEALGWTAHEPVGWRVVLGAAIGVAVPAAIGMLTARPAIGFAVAMGAMLFGGPDSEQGREHEAGRRSLAEIFASAVFVGLAPPIATLCAGWNWGDAVAIAIVALLAAVSGYSRPFAVAATRFIAFLVMSMSIMSQPGGHPGGVALLLGIGSIWGAIVRVALRPAAKKAPAAPVAKPQPTRSQRIKRLKRVLAEMSGWQYPIRLALALGAASLLRHLEPDRHFGWVLVTVVLLIERQPEILPVKTTQRAAGVVLGVALTGLVLTEIRSPFAIAALVCLLATLRPWLRARNYLAYSGVMTPLILLVMDLGRPIGGDILVDRLIATLLGAAIVVVINWLAVRFVVGEPGDGEKVASP